MDRNEQQAQWIVRKKWLPETIIRTALKTLEKNPLDHSDLVELLIQRGMLSQTQGQELRAVLEGSQRYHAPGPQGQASGPHRRPDAVAMTRSDGDELLESQRMTAADILRNLNKHSAKSLHGRQFAGCTILDLISQGGMGVVFKAKHDTLGQDLALKMLALPQNLKVDPKNKDEERFKREVSVLSRLQHEHIIPVKDAGYEGGIFYLVMKYVAGQDLQSVIDSQLKKQQPVDLDFAIQTTIKISSALEQCHAHGLVHRDVKPANIILNEDLSHPYLIDFGIVKLVSKQTPLSTLNDQLRMSLSNPGEILGTPVFLAPEQIDVKQTVSPETDVWGLAATLFSTLTGAKPFGDAPEQDYFRAVFSAPAPDLRAHRSDAPRWLTQLIREAMAKDQNQRPAMSEFRQRLERGLNTKERSFPLAAMASVLAVVALISLLLSMDLSPSKDPKTKLPKAPTEESLKAAQGTLAGLDDALVFELGVGAQSESQRAQLKSLIETQQLGLAEQIIERERVLALIAGQLQSTEPRSSSGEAWERELQSLHQRVEKLSPWYSLELSILKKGAQHTETREKMTQLSRLERLPASADVRLARLEARLGQGRQALERLENRLQLSSDKLVTRRLLWGSLQVASSLDDQQAFDTVFQKWMVHPGASDLLNRAEVIGHFWLVPKMTVSQWRQLLAAMGSQSEWKPLIQAEIDLRCRCFRTCDARLRILPSSEQAHVEIVKQWIQARRNHARFKYVDARVLLESLINACKAAQWRALATRARLALVQNLYCLGLLKEGNGVVEDLALELNNDQSPLGRSRLFRAYLWKAHSVLCELASANIRAGLDRFTDLKSLYEEAGKFAPEGTLDPTHLILQCLFTKTKPKDLRSQIKLDSITNIMSQAHYHWKLWTVLNKEPEQRQAIDHFLRLSRFPRPRAVAELQLEIRRLTMDIERKRSVFPKSQIPQMFRKLHLLQPFDARSWWLERLTFRALGQRQDDYNRGIVSYQLDPTDPSNWQAYADLLKTGKERLNALRQAVRFDERLKCRSAPKRALLLAAYGLELVRQGRKKQGLAALLSACETYQANGILLQYPLSDSFKDQLVAKDRDLLLKMRKRLNESQMSLDTSIEVYRRGRFEDTLAFTNANPRVLSDQQLSRLLWIDGHSHLQLQGERVYAKVLKTLIESVHLDGIQMEGLLALILECKQPFEKSMNLETALSKLKSDCKANWPVLFKVVQDSALGKKLSLPYEQVEAILSAYELSQVENTGLNLLRAQLQLIYGYPLDALEQLVAQRRAWGQRRGLFGSGYLEFLESYALFSENRMGEARSALKKSNQLGWKRPSRSVIQRAFSSAFADWVRREKNS